MNSEQASPPQIADTFTWELKDGILAINGEGELPAFGRYKDDGWELVPWHSGIDSITQMVFGPGITGFQYYLFHDYPHLVSVTLSDSVTDIGNGFGRCPAFTAICVGAKHPVFSSDNGVLYSKDKTRLILYPEGKQGDYTIPDSVVEIDVSFCDLDGISAINAGAGNPNWSSVDGVLFNKDQTTLVCYPKRKQGASYTIPDSVVEVSEFAFRDCGNLTEVVIPASVSKSSIRSYTSFSGCDALTAVHVKAGNPHLASEDGVVYSGDKTQMLFYPCNKQGDCTIPDSLAEIECRFAGIDGLTAIHARAGNPNFSSVDGVLFNSDRTTLVCYPKGKWGASYIIPNSVVTIGNSAFHDCADLTEVIIPDSVTHIGEYAFSGCAGLQSIIIPRSVTFIDEEAFHGGAGLTSIDLPDSITHLRFAVFAGCPLTSVSIPDSVTRIDGLAFGGCTSLTEVIIPDSVVEIGDWAFRDCAGLTSVSIGRSVTHIGALTFAGCTGLTSVVIPDSVTRLERWAFRDCAGLTSITIGSSVTHIHEAAFAGCTALAEIICRAATPPEVDPAAFDGDTLSLCTLRVPADALERYRATAPSANPYCVPTWWAWFENIDAITP